MDNVQEYLSFLSSVCLSVFDDEQGLKMIYEVPDGFVSAPQKDGQPSIFDQTSDYLIPKQGLCGHLITICLKKYKVLGFPVSISSDKYDRQLFVFNVAFVFDRNAELAAYEPVVRKTGRVLKAIEESTGLLSLTEKRTRMYSVLEQLFEDLNSYSETCIQLDGVRSLDLRLFPVFPNPPPVNEWDVPLSLINLSSYQEASWDMTLLRLIPFIDGVRSAKAVASAADVDLDLAIECLQHLLYYSCIMLIDLFQFSNSYALIGGPTSLAETCGDVDGTEMGFECSAYVSTSTTPVPPQVLLKLYAQLAPGYTVSDWIEEHQVYLLDLDVRRMMTFGVIKGFLRRCHCFPVWLDHPSLKASSATANGNANGRSLPIYRDDSASRSRSRSLSVARNTSSTMTMRAPSQQGRLLQVPPSLANMLDGTHHTDELCLSYECNFSTLKIMLARIGRAENPNTTHDLGRVQLLYL